MTNTSFNVVFRKVTKTFFFAVALFFGASLAPDFIAKHQGFAIEFGATARAEPLTPGSEMVFRGVCDGSSAVIIDEDTLLVAYDETRSLFSFELSSGHLIGQHDVGDALDFDNMDEFDLEASAHDGDRIWWIGSHGRDKKGRTAPNRKVLFTTNIPSADLNDLSAKAAKVDLIATFSASPKSKSLLTQEVLDRKPKKGGLNIEGLAIHPQGGLMIGFRSPLSAPDGMSGDALVIHIVENGGGFAVNAVHQLDLGDRGVRSLMRHDSGFVLLAGTVASGGTTSLFTWDGQSAPVENQSADLAGMNPEAIVRIDDNWLVLSDDGKVKRRDDSADDGDRKCDKIWKNHANQTMHPSVFFRSKVIAP